MVELTDLTRVYAADWAAGKYPFVSFTTDTRWHQRVYRDPNVDIWLISWLPEQGTQLHDHGGSSGAFTVLTGTLTESVPSGFADARVQVRDNLRQAGDTVSFGKHYVHDVRNLGTESAISVHAYSPPLTSMTFYDLADGDLTVLATLATDDPETVLPAVA